MVFNHLKMEKLYYLEVNEIIFVAFLCTILLFYIPATLGSMRSPPAVLPRVCVAPSTLTQHLGRVNISWDPLPCHLQNGADTSGYIINYTPLSTGVTTRISSSDSGVECNQGFGDLYSCVVAELLIPNNQSYCIQVAAQNRHGNGSFSSPINVFVPVSSRYYNIAA